MNEPKLRFPEFTGDWVQHNLSDVIVDIADGPFGSNLKLEHYTDKKEARIVQLSNLSDYGWQEDNTRYTTFEHAEEIKRCIVNEGELIMGKMMPAGMTIMRPTTDKMYVLSSDCVRIKLDRSVVADGFFLYTTKSPEFLSQIRIGSQGSTRIRTSISKIKNMNFNVPSLEEQEKIASLFSEIDTLIQLAEKELEGYRELKKGMLQKMFPKNGETVPEIRFPEFTGDWEQRKLGDIADVTKLAGFEFTKHVVYSDEGNIIALRGLNIKNGQLILDDVKYIDGSNFSKLSRSKLFIDDIMFTYVGTVGEVAIIKENDRFYLAPNVSRIRVKSDDSPKFISHYMRTDNFKNKVIFPLIATSSQPALSMENIRKFTINIPTNREEQDRLARYFDNLDNLITLQQKELDGYKELKKGLLQQMFC